MCLIEKEPDIPSVFMSDFRPFLSDMRCEFVEKLAKLRYRTVVFFIISSHNPCKA